MKFLAALWWAFGWWAERLFGRAEPAPVSIEDVRKLEHDSAIASAVLEVSSSHRHRFRYSIEGDICECGEVEHDALAREVGAVCYECGAGAPGLYNFGSSPRSWKCHREHRARCMKRQMDQ